MPSHELESAEYTELDALMRLDDSIVNLSKMLDERLGNIRCELEEINKKLNEKNG